MSLFAPSFYSEPSFSGLFRLIDDFDNYRSQAANNGNHEVGRTGHRQLLKSHLPTFTPKFDLKETETAYELHGDLPGIDKKDVNIEFAGEHTLLIRGKVERSYTNDGETGDDDNNTAIPPPPRASDKEETGTAAANEKVAEDKTADATTTTEVAEAAQTSDNKQVSATPAAPSKAKYWISERSVGEFSRTFNFPTAVDHEAVKASLSDGVLTVIVPKAQKPQNRRVTVN